MASPLGLIRGLLGKTIAESASFAAGIAIAPVLHPVVQQIANDTWALYPNRPPDATMLAMGVAQGQVDPAQAAQWAKETGFGDEAFAALVDIANTGPPLGSALDALRRGLLTEKDYRTALKRQGIEDQWADALVGLAQVLLSPAELANAVVQGHRDFDAAAIDAGKQGVSIANFQTMVDNTGLPPGPETLVAWKRRGILTDEELAQGIREGHTKVKYIDAYRQSEAVVLNSTVYAGLRLRGWITPQESYTGGELTGFTKEQMDLMYLNRGRPATTHQVHIGYARGGRYIGENLTEQETFARAVKQSDLRPEWEDILWNSRFTYPSAFVLRAMAADGTFTAAQTEEILVKSGWEPDLAHLAAVKWAGGTAGKQKEETAAHLTAEYEFGHLTEQELVAALGKLGYSDTAAAMEVALADAKQTKKYRDRAIESVSKRYIGSRLTDPDAVAALDKLGVTAKAQQSYLAAWKLEREDAESTLTRPQIKKAYSATIFTRDQALGLLQADGMYPADAGTFLDS